MKNILLFSVYDIMLIIDFNNSIIMLYIVLDAK